MKNRQVLYTGAITDAEIHLTSGLLEKSRPPQFDHLHQSVVLGIRILQPPHMSGTPLVRRYGAQAYVFGTGQLISC